MGYTRWPVINSVLTAANAAALPIAGTADGTLGVMSLNDVGVDVETLEELADGTRIVDGDEELALELPHILSELGEWELV